MNWHHTDGRARTPAEELLLALEPSDWVTYTAYLPRPGRLVVRVELVDCNGETHGDRADRDPGAHRDAGARPLSLEIEGCGPISEPPDAPAASWIASIAAPGWYRLRLTWRERCSMLRVRLDLASAISTVGGPSRASSDVHLAGNQEQSRFARRTAGSITLLQVAQHAGVSPSAASKAIRGGYGVSPRLREAVFGAALELGYQWPRRRRITPSDRQAMQAGVEE